MQKSQNKMYSITSRTKKMLIDAARELFASKGKDNITMNDIAEASNKGRRTLYTYFKNKNDVYKAVVENEIQLVLEALKANSERNYNAFDKLKNHIFIHLDKIRESVMRNGSLRADFFNDIYEVERSRRRMDIIELKLIDQILREGIEEGVFKSMDIETMSIILLHSLKGLEVPFIRKSLTSTAEEIKNELVELIFKGLLK